MTHGEIRGTLILLALMALVVCATYVARLQKWESAPVEKSSTSPSQCATLPQLYDGSVTRRQLDSMNLEDAASRQTSRDSIARAAKSAHRKTDASGATKTGKPARKTAINKPSRSHTPVPSPLDRPL